MARCLFDPLSPALGRMFPTRPTDFLLAKCHPAFLARPGQSIRGLPVQREKAVLFHNPLHPYSRLPEWEWTHLN